MSALAVAVFFLSSLVSVLVVFVAVVLSSFLLESTFSCCFLLVSAFAVAVVVLVLSSVLLVSALAVAVFVLSSLVSVLVVFVAVVLSSFLLVSALAFSFLLALVLSTGLSYSLPESALGIYIGPSTLCDK